MLSKLLCQKLIAPSLPRPKIEVFKIQSTVSTVICKKTYLFERQISLIEHFLSYCLSMKTATGNHNWITDLSSRSTLLNIFLHSNLSYLPLPRCWCGFTARTGPLLFPLVDTGEKKKIETSVPPTLLLTSTLPTLIGGPQKCASL